MKHAGHNWLQTRVRAATVAIAALAATVLVSPPAAHAGPSSSPGTWAGELSGQTFSLVVWNTLNEANATIVFQNIGRSENLQYLGSKKGVDYFFRLTDRAALSVYIDGPTTYLSYFERDEVRTVVLTRER